MGFYFSSHDRSTHNNNEEINRANIAETRERKRENGFCFLNFILNVLTMVKWGVRWVWPVWFGRRLVRSRAQNPTYKIPLFHFSFPSAKHFLSLKKNQQTLSLSLSPLCFSLQPPHPPPTRTHQETQREKRREAQRERGTEPNPYSSDRTVR